MEEEGEERSEVKGTVWQNILRVGRLIDEDGLNFTKSFHKDVGDGEETCIWLDKWRGDGTLGERYRRLIRLEVDLKAKIAERGRWVDNKWEWKWNWRREPRGRERGEQEELERELCEWEPDKEKKDKWSWEYDKEGGFSVKRLREKLGEGENIGRGRRTVWSHIVPKKINILMWRVRRGRIPTREALNERGIDVHSVLCPRCGKEIESIDHALLNCEEVRGIWEEVGRWWSKNISGMNQISQLVQEDEELERDSKGTSVWMGVKWSILYLIWNHRNRIIFKGDKSKLNVVFLEWQRIIFEWVGARIKKQNLEWFSWLAGTTREVREEEDRGFYE